MATIASRCHRVLVASWGLLLLALTVSGAAAEVAVVDAAMLRLDDGRLVRLDGMVVPGPMQAEAMRRLATLLKGGEPVIDVTGEDRRGRSVGVLRVGGSDLAVVLLAEGLAWHAPVGRPADGQRAAAEAEARAARRGLWARPELAEDDAARVPAAPARFAVVTGVVRRVGSGQRWTYLNFGEDRRQDFTVRIAAGPLRVLRRAGVDPRALEGRLVRVRGWVVDQDGPMMEIEWPQQIELLP